MHHFHDELVPLTILPSFNEEIADNLPTEEAADVTLEENREALDESESEVQVTNITPSTGIRKRTRSSTRMQAGPSLASKKAKGKAPIFAFLKAKNAYIKHFYTKESQDRMHDFEGNPSWL